MNWINILRYGGLALFLTSLGVGAYQARRTSRTLPAGWLSATLSVLLMFSSGWIENYSLALMWSIAALLLLGVAVWQYVRSSAKARSAG